METYTFQIGERMMAVTSAWHALLVACCFLLVLFAFDTIGLAQTVNEDFRSSTDVFLRRLTVAEQDGMGRSFVSSTTGADSLNTNPAGLAYLEHNRLTTQATRFPHTIAVISKPNTEERYEEYAQYDLRAAGLEFINYSRPLGARGALGLNVAFGHEGRFSRVDELGKSINTFPESEFAVGLGYAIRLLPGASVGVNAKWLRAKVQDETGAAHIGHGYAYNVGLIQRVGANLRLGAVLRNLSNGLSFSEDNIPDKVLRDSVLGGTYLFTRNDVRARISADVNPPFEDGLRTNLGGEIWYRDFVGVRIGYMRHTEKRFDGFRLIETDEPAFDERLWKAEGLTLGVGVQLGKLNINAAVTPPIAPVAEVNEQIRIEQGRSVYAFSVGQRF